VLASPWFSDSLSDLRSKDASLEMRGVWILELAELDTMSRAESGTIKAFISRAHVRFRPPYGKRVVELARQCVFAGSINPEGGYLKDATGGRRFWPVVCGSIDIKALERDRDQIWAEACVRFREGQAWWMENSELESLAANQQKERYHGDAWEEPIRTYLQYKITRERDHAGNWVQSRMERAEPLSDVSVAEILKEALWIEAGRWTQADQNRVVHCLTSMGFAQYRPGGRSASERQRRYRRLTV
jgi:predicted P-loop ATPase